MATSIENSKRTWSARVLGVSAACLATLASCVTSKAQTTETVIFDGFGDADLDNNGTAFEGVDVNVGGAPGGGFWRPGRLGTTALPGDFNNNLRVDAVDYALWRNNLNGDAATLNGNGNGDSVVDQLDYNIWRQNYGTVAPLNAELTEADGVDESDPGIKWFQMRGWTGANNGQPGSGQSKPYLRILDDTQGAQLETRSVSENGLNRAAIDSGYALSWESKGGGSSAAGFFPENVALGPNAGDAVKVSFDFRLWGDTPNAEELSPDYSDLRFGIFQDTDNQLGMTNPFAGRQVDENGDATTDLKPAVWGEEEGMFFGGLPAQANQDYLIGSIGDAGWTASVWVGDNVPAGSPDITFENGGNARIREELQADDILEGGDVEFVARAPNINPDAAGKPEYDFIDMDPEKVYNISLTLERDAENGIVATLTVVDYADGNAEYSFSGTQAAGEWGSDNWDYFVMRNATSGANEIDFIIDNFMVEKTTAAAGLAGATSAPEPAGLALLGLAAFRVLRRKR